MSEAKSKIVIMQFASMYAQYFSRVARVLKKKYGVDSVLVLTSAKMLPPDPSVIDLDFDDFLEVVDMDEWIVPRPDAEIPPADDLAEQALEIEKKYDVSLIDMLRADRHLAHGYITGANFAMSEYGRSANYRQSIDIIVRMCHFYVELLDKYKPYALYGTPSTVVFAPLTDIAASQGIPFRYIVKGRTAESNFHWAMNRAGEWWGVVDAYQEYMDDRSKLVIEQEEFPEIATPYRTKRNVGQANRCLAFRNCCRIIFIVLAQRAKRAIRGGGSIYGNYLVKETILLRLKAWWINLKYRLAENISESLPEGCRLYSFPFRSNPK